MVPEGQPKWPRMLFIFLILSKTFVFLTPQWYYRDITIGFLLNYRVVMTMSGAKLEKSAFFRLQVVELKMFPRLSVR